MVLVTRNGKDFRGCPWALSPSCRLRSNGNGEAALSIGMLLLTVVPDMMRGQLGPTIVSASAGGLCGASMGCASGGELQLRTA